MIEGLCDDEFYPLKYYFLKFHIPMPTLRTWVQNRKIEHIKIGGVIRISGKSFKELVEERKRTSDIISGLIDQ